MGGIGSSKRGMAGRRAEISRGRSGEGGARGTNEGHGKADAQRRSRGGAPKRRERLRRHNGKEPSFQTSRSLRPSPTPSCQGSIHPPPIPTAPSEMPSFFPFCAPSLAHVAPRNDADSECNTDKEGDAGNTRGGAERRETGRTRGSAGTRRQLPRGACRDRSGEEKKGGRGARRTKNKNTMQRWAAGGGGIENGRKERRPKGTTWREGCLDPGQRPEMDSCRRREMAGREAGIAWERVAAERRGDVGRGGRDEGRGAATARWGRGRAAGSLRGATKGQPVASVAAKEREAAGGIGGGANAEAAGALSGGKSAERDGCLERRKSSKG